MILIVIKHVVVLECGRRPTNYGFLVKVLQGLDYGRKFGVWLRCRNEMSFLYFLSSRTSQLVKLSPPEGKVALVGPGCARTIHKIVK